MLFLGVIANAGSDVVNNLTTAAPFTIPAGTRALRLQPSAATQMAATIGGSDAAFLPAAAAMLQLGGANSVLDVPINSVGNAASAFTVAVRKTDAGAATCKVFAIAL